MEQFIQLLSQKYPSIMEAKDNILKFINDLQKKYPFLNEEDLQQLILMQGVDQGEIPENEYNLMVAEREMPNNIPRISGDKNMGSQADFSAISNFIGNKV